MAKQQVRYSEPDWLPKTKAEKEMLARYRGWSRSRRMKGAVAELLRGQESVSQVARNFGLSRQHVGKNARAARLELVEQGILTEEEAIYVTPSEKGRKAAEAQAILGARAVDVRNERRRVPDDFWEFDRLYFGHWGCPDCDDEAGDPARHAPAPFHREIMAACNDPAKMRVLINLPPYHAKTTYITVKRTVWKLCQNPNYRSLIISNAETFGKTIVQSISEILTNPDLYLGAERNLVEDWGPFQGDGAWNQTQLYVAGRVTAEKDPTVQVAGISTTIYGKRADEVIFDDVVDVKRSRNPDVVEDDLRWCMKEPLSRIGKKGKAIFVGTRVGSGDLYSQLSAIETFHTMKYPAIIDDLRKKVLWPEHFPYSQLMVQKAEMSPADFQLVYQQVEIPGAGATFTEEMVENAKDSERPWGHYDGAWVMVAGLDPAGANRHSGYTAMVLMALDTLTGKRYVVDLVNVKQMKAPQIFAQMKAWAADYPLVEWRVESNGLQSQLVQYNQEINEELALLGCRVKPHFTHGNKWDPQFGVESMSPWFTSGLMSIPWRDHATRARFQPLVDQLLGFPMTSVSDCVMALWFADLACRDIMRRQHLPLFNSRQKVPRRIRDRRRVVDFASGEIRRVSEDEQRPGHLSRSGRNLRRVTAGSPQPHHEVEEFGPPEPRNYVNLGDSEP